MKSQGRSFSVENRALIFRVKGWAVISFLMLFTALVLIFQGGLFMDVDGREVGIGQMLWLPGLIGSCSCLWLLLTLTGTRTNISISISLIALASAEVCTLLLPVWEVSGLNWEAGNGLVPAISFASLAITALTWTATGVVDPLRQNWWTYGVAFAATALIGLILSYQYLWFLQGVMATTLASSLVWGLAYDGKLHHYSSGKRTKRRSAPVSLFLITFLALPMLMLGLPYLLR
ncbi:MAG: hypothetical protein MIO90_07690 [Methanomassiliicoccales archaeon]|nr:hypothetical protein [Methanomassiliicoccales archaeon]